jgi:hypothetical protein
MQKGRLLGGLCLFVIPAAAQGRAGIVQQLGSDGPGYFALRKFRDDG